jgi:crossover junction endodeoxyribonuclease RusA
MADPRTWTLVIPGPGGTINSANKDHSMGRWWTTHQRRMARQSGGWHARAAKIPGLERARIESVIRVRGWANADPQNYPGGSTMKGILDGLVDAGVVPDDSHRHLDVTMPILAKPRAPRQYEIELIITEVVA